MAEKPAKFYCRPGASHYWGTDALGVEDWHPLPSVFTPPIFSSFSIQGQANPLEVGDSIPTNVTFIWLTTEVTPGSIQPNSIDILDITLALTLASGLADDSSQAVVMPGAVVHTTAATHTFRITGLDSVGDTFLRNVVYTWYWRMFYGNSANATLTEAQIEALAGSELKATALGSFACGAGNYKYLCYSDALGDQFSNIRDLATGFSVPMATASDDAFYANTDAGGYDYGLVSVTNADAVTEDYRVYRTKNLLGGSVTLLVT